MQKTNSPNRRQFKGKIGNFHRDSMASSAQSESNNYISNVNSNQQKVKKIAFNKRVKINS